MGIASDSKLDFKFHVDQKIRKCNKLIGFMRRLKFLKEGPTHYIPIAF